jgi:DNA-binding MarR family transcriptional regulator
MLDEYLEVTSLIDRLHRFTFREIERGLYQSGVTNISGVQAFILISIGAGKSRVNQIRNQTGYVGTKVTKLLIDLIKNGYVLRARSLYDQREQDVWLSTKGGAVYDQLTEMYVGRVERFFPRRVRSDLTRTLKTLQQMEDFWIDQALDR